MSEDKDEVIKHLKEVIESLRISRSKFESLYYEAYEGKVLAEMKLEKADSLNGRLMRENEELKEQPDNPPEQFTVTLIPQYRKN